MAKGDKPTTEKPEVTVDNSVELENKRLKLELEMLKSNLGVAPTIEINPETEEHTFIYQSSYPRKVQIAKAVSTWTPDGMGGRTQKLVRNAIYARFTGSRGDLGYFTLNKNVAQTAGVSVTEFQKLLEESSQFVNGDIERILKTKDGKEVEKYAGKLKRSAPITKSGVVAI